MLLEGGALEGQKLVELFVQLVEKVTEVMALQQGLPAFAQPTG